MRVMLVDPGSEGLALAATLRGAGFEVELGALDVVAHAKCDVLVIAGDAPGALAALRALRDDGPRPDTKVVLVGAPQGMSIRTQGPAFGADWALSRDEAPDHLAAAVRKVALAGGVHSDGQSYRERTLELTSERSQVSARHGNTDEEGEPPSGEIEVHRASDKSDPAIALGPERDSSSVELEFDAKVSPALASLLMAADRRVFPNLPSIDPSLPRGESRARDLVPEDVIRMPAAEPEDEPILDALTFVGAVPQAGPAPRSDTMPPPAPERPATRSKSVPPPPPDGIARTPMGALTPSRTPASRSSAATPSGKSLVRPPEPPAVAITRGEGNVLSWLGPFAALRGEAPTFRLTLASGSRELALTVEQGHVTDLAAPVSQRVLALLDGASAEPASEDEAGRTLALRERAGLLGGVLRRELTERARLGALGEMMADDVRWTLEPAAPRPTAARPFARRFWPVLCHAAGAHLDRDRVAELLGGPQVSLTPGASFAEIARALELPLALEELLRTETRLGAIRSHAGGLGLGSVLVAVGLGGLVARATTTGSELPRAELLRSRLKSLGTSIEDADYFAILGVPRDADASRIEFAHELLTSELDGLAPAVMGHDEAAEELARVRASLDDAQRILKNERWRNAYVQALSHPYAGSR